MKNNLYILYCIVELPFISMIALISYFCVGQVIRRETGTIEHHFFRDLPKLLDSSYLIVMNNSKVINCKLQPTYYDTPLIASQDLKQKLKVEGKSLVVYLLKQLSSDRWLVSGDDELESKSVGFEVFISQPQTTCNSNVDSRIIVGTLVQIDDDGSLEMVFRFVDGNNNSASSVNSSSNEHGDRNYSDLKVALLAAASIPLPPYIEAENAIKVIYFSMHSMVTSFFCDYCFMYLATTKIAPSYKYTHFEGG
jgi:S-adenosylmethionine:tRNA-ribosyltransferase-isomerase (queuine synthetase)